MKRVSDQQKFMDQVFRELDDLQAAHPRKVVNKYADRYGLTLDEVFDLYRPGMNGRQLHEAMWVARRITPKEP